MGIEGVLQEGFVTTTADKLINYMRTGSMWPVMMFATFTSPSDGADAWVPTAVDARPRVSVHRKEKPHTGGISVWGGPSSRRGIGARKGSRRHAPTGWGGG